MTMPKNLILIRHGYSEANEIQKNQDKYETEELVTIPDRQWRLTAKGIEQAKSIGKIFETGRLSQIDSFYVSPYKRTLETASYMNINDASWQLMRTLRERSWGDIDTLPTKIFKDEHPRNFRTKQTDPLYWMPPSGESIASVADNRVSKMLTHMHREHAGENVVMVTHHDFILACRLSIEHLTDDEFTHAMMNDTMNVPNGSAIWYSRVNPFTARLEDKICSYRIITPMLDKNNDFVNAYGIWKLIKRPRYTNAELLTLSEETNHARIYEQRML